MTVRAASRRRAPPADRVMAGSPSPAINPTMTTTRMISTRVKPAGRPRAGAVLPPDGGQ
ncbi:MAG: hypothetical protein U1G05_06545 [Kiritimatiellia bacterium]